MTKSKAELIYCIVAVAAAVLAGVLKCATASPPCRRGNPLDS